jgi:exodeoxyribonuclease-5
MITRDQLSEEQELALQHMIAFTKGTERQMLLGGYAGTGKCLDASTIIWTSNGLKRLKSISNDSHVYDTALECDVDVLSFNKTTKRVCIDNATHIWKDSKTSGIEFILDKGYSHKVSDWHPIYCSVNGIDDYYKASDLKHAVNMGAEVWFPIIQGHPSWNISRYAKINTERYNDVIVDEGIAYILGALVGDGSLTNTTLNTTTFSNIDDTILSSLLDSAISSSIELSISHKGDSSCDWRITSSVISDIIRALNMNVKSIHKSIPDVIIESPKSVIASFIRGLFDTDGSAGKRDGYIEYCTASKSLAEDVHALLLAFGIICRKKYRPNKCSGSWNVYINGENATKFYDIIGFNCVRKQERRSNLKVNNNSNDKLFPPSLAYVMERAFLTRLDRIPNDEATLSRIGSYYERNHKLSNYYVDYYKGRRTPSRNKLCEFISDVGGNDLSELSDFVSDNKIWLRVTSCNDINIDLYDLTVPNNSAFIANGIINHNTTLVKVFLEHVKLKTNFACICTAPTNEAVRVLSKATGVKYDKTIYSLLGLALVHEDDTKPKLKPSGKAKIEEYDIVVIDEASMIDSDIFEIIQQQLNAHSYIKIIYVGDDAQLPPIIDVQNYNRTKSRVFDIKNQVVLREVQRVAKGNPIIDVVTPIRNNLLSAQDHFERKTILKGDHGVVFHDSRDEFMELLFDDFTSDIYKDNSNFVRAIAYTNKAIDAMNIHIRRKLFNTKDLNEYMIGENLIVDSPVVEKITSKVSKIVYAVGERLRVLFVNQFTDSEYGYRVWELRVVNYEEETDEQVTKTLRIIHKDDIPYYDAALTELAQLSKEKELKMMNGKDGKPRPMYTKFEAWKDYFAFKEQYSWVKYSYAMTTHKSQGSTVERVYVVERDLNKLTWNDEERNKLKYVAFTRASHILRILQ